jgi:hypothetical protein
MIFSITCLAICGPMIPRCLPGRNFLRLRLCQLSDIRSFSGRLENHTHRVSTFESQLRIVFLVTLFTAIGATGASAAL